MPLAYSTKPSRTCSIASEGEIAARTSCLAEHGQLGHRRYATQPVSRNGKHHPARPRIELEGSASPEEAAAIAAAIEQFLRDTAPRRRPAERR